MWSGVLKCLQGQYRVCSVTEDCKLVVTCKMQNGNATDKLNPQCSIVNNANLLHC